MKYKDAGRLQTERGAWQNRFCYSKSSAHKPSDDTGNLPQTRVINVLFQCPTRGLPHRCWYWVFRL